MDPIVEKILGLVKYSESKHSREKFLEELLQSVVEILNAEFCVLAFFDKTDENLFYHIACWKHNKMTKKFSDEFSKIKKGTGSVGICAEKLIVKSYEKQDVLEGDRIEHKEIFNIDTTSVLAAPMLSRGKLIGVLKVLNKCGDGSFNKNDEINIRILSSYAAVEVDNANILNEIIAKDRISSLGQSIMSSAHEIKNILNNMDGGAFIVEKGAYSKDIRQVEKGWDIIKRNTNRLRELVLDILLFSRPQKLEFKPSNINRICEDVEDLLRKNAKANNVEIKLFLDKSIGEFFFDPKGIHRCLLNLISNAVHACSQKGGGRANVTTKLKAKDVLEIIISDNGVGISEDNLPHIFDVFFTTKGSGGTGLGLPVTKKIIDEHYGSIEVKSAVNIGTKFIITLPNSQLA